MTNRIVNNQSPFRDLIEKLAPNGEPISPGEIQLPNRIRKVAIADGFENGSEVQGGVNTAGEAYVQFLELCAALGIESSELNRTSPAEVFSQNLTKLVEQVDERANSLLERLGTPGIKAPALYSLRYLNSTKASFEKEQIPPGVYLPIFRQAYLRLFERGFTPDNKNFAAFHEAENQGWLKVSDISQERIQEAKETSGQKRMRDLALADLKAFVEDPTITDLEWLLSFVKQSPPLITQEELRGAVKTKLGKIDNNFFNEEFFHLHNEFATAKPENLSQLFKVCLAEHACLAAIGEGYDTALLSRNFEVVSESELKAAIKQGATMTFFTGSNAFEPYLERRHIKITEEDCKSAFPRFVERHLRNNVIINSYSNHELLNRCKAACETLGITDQFNKAVEEILARELYSSTEMYAANAQAVANLFPHLRVPEKKPLWYNGVRVDEALRTAEPDAAEVATFRAIVEKFIEMSPVELNSKKLEEAWFKLTQELSRDGERLSPRDDQLYFSEIKRILRANTNN